jgi:hypothetical protein
MGRRLIGTRISGTAAALVLLGFFLPWVVISCNETPWLTLSGDQLAVGGEFTDEFGSKTEEIPGESLLLLVPATAFLVLLVAGAAYLLVRAGIVSRIVPTAFGVMLGAVQAILGILGALAMYQVLSGMGDHWNSTGGGTSSGMGLSVRLQYGLWMTAAGLLGVILGGIIGVVEVVLRRGSGDVEPKGKETD